MNLLLYIFIKVSKVNKINLIVIKLIERSWPYTYDKNAYCNIHIGAFRCKIQSKICQIDWFQNLCRCFGFMLPTLGS